MKTFLPIPYGAVTKALLLASLASFALSAHADQQIADNVEVTGLFTLRQDAFMEGSVSIGKLPSTLSGGVKVEVTQEVISAAHEEVIPGHIENQSNYVDDWGWITQATSYWVDDYGYYDQQVWVDEYGWVYYSEVWVNEVTDVDGNVVNPGHYETPSPTWGVVGGSWTTQGTWGIVGGHSETSGMDQWGVVSSHIATTETWVDEVRTNYPGVYGVPLTKFTGQADDMVWRWLNNGRQLMELSTSGVNVPLPGDYAGANKAMFTSTQFEQSYTTPTDFMGEYASYGSKLSKESLETWLDTGEEQAVSESSTAKLKPTELLIQKKIPNPNGVSSTTIGTRIAANDASFGGSVAIKGVLRVNPAGDLPMGEYSNGPHP